MRARDREAIVRAMMELARVAPAEIPGVLRFVKRRAAELGKEARSAATPRARRGTP